MKLITFVIGLFLFLGCAGPNPNLGERTADMAWHNRDYNAAISIIKPKAMKGYPWAQLRMCAAYKYGVGVPKNPTEAVMWCKKASVQEAEGGWAEGKIVGAIGKSGYFNQNSDALIAQFQLADFYYKGEGVQKDLTIAYLYIKRVVDKTKGKSIFYCCEFAGGRYITSNQIADLNELIQNEMTEEQIQNAEKKRLNWAPRNNE